MAVQLQQIKETPMRSKGTQMMLPGAAQGALFSDGCAIQTFSNITTSTMHTTTVNGIELVP